MLCYAKSLQSCLTLCDPIDGSHQAPSSLGFSRQEHWSGLPFPSPMRESEKWKGSRSVVSEPQRPHGLQPTRLLHPWDFPGKSTGVGCHCLLRRETKELGMETCPWEGVVRIRSFHTVGNPLIGRSVGSFGISEGNVAGRKKKKKTHRIKTVF